MRTDTVSISHVSALQLKCPGAANNMRPGKDEIAAISGRRKWNMSAYMVCKSHIDQLVNVAYYGPKDVLIQSGHWYRPYFRNCELNNDQLNDLGEMFVKENLSSIHSRYPDTLTNPADTPGPREQYWLTPYVFERPSRRMTAVEALKAISCYEYQSCEHEEWERSEAHRFCKTLRDALITRLPGYEQAAWECDEVSNG